VAQAGGWAGSLLGSVAGLSWADDFNPDADTQTAGIARLAWWISCGAFLAAGGLGAIAAGLVDSLRIAPVGLLLPATGGGPAATLADLATRIPAAALALALALAVPALVAVLALHLAIAICLRTVPFLPGQGLVQALAAVTLLAALYAGADAWSGGFAALVQGPLERSFDIR
jgi:flagellar biosynthesis protein FliR